MSDVAHMNEARRAMQKVQRLYNESNHVTFVDESHHTSDVYVTASRHTYKIVTKGVKESGRNQGYRVVNSSWRARKKSRCTGVIVYICTVQCTKYTCVYIYMLGYW